MEEAFAPLVRLHPAVGDGHSGGLAALAQVALRAGDAVAKLPAACAPSVRNATTLIVDSQGLLRSGVIARLAHGRRHGYDAASIREPLASPFYDVRHRVSRELHAVERNRILSGLALRL